MKTLSKVIITTLSFFALSLPAMANSYLENGIPVCGVPVCNVTEVANHLRTLDSQAREQFFVEFQQMHQHSQSRKIFKNIAQFGAEALNLALELQDEDRVVNLAASIRNMGLVGLIKYSPIVAEDMLDLFKQLDDAQSRQAVLSFWISKLPEIVNLGVLEELMNFSLVAREYSQEQGDEDAVLSVSLQLVQDITTKLNRLDPAHEGLYNVEVDMSGVKSNMLPFDRIAILDSSAEDNLLVSFINNQHRFIVFRYQKVKFEGNKMSGEFFTGSGVSSRFAMHFNRITGEIVGKIETTNLDEITFRGKQIFSTRPNYSEETPFELAESDIIGNLDGEISGVQGTLSVKSFNTGIYSATFKSKTGSLLLHFQGRFNASKGVLSLTSGEILKLTLSMRETEEGPMWVGNTFNTTNGAVATAIFHVLK